jgi:hypothetical protein
MKEKTTICVDIETHAKLLEIRKRLQVSFNKIYSMSAVVKYLADYYINSGGDVLGNENTHNNHESKRV